MKSDIVEGRYYIECTCGMEDHLIVFDVFPFDEDFSEVSVSFTSGYHPSFIDRVKTAFNYIFKKEKYLHTSDSVIINEHNLSQLKTIVTKIEELAKTKKLV